MNDAPVPTASSFVWFLFRVDRPIGRRDYLLVGVGLLLFKYVVEATLLFSLAGVVLPFQAFLSPTFGARFADFPAFAWLAPLFFLWSLPFLWIAVAMTSRRARDAGLSPWHGLIVLAPFVNLIAVVLAALLPTDFFQKTAASHNSAASEPTKLDPASAGASPDASPYKPTFSHYDASPFDDAEQAALQKIASSEDAQRPHGSYLLLTLLAGAFTPALMFVLVVMGQGRYGEILFVAAPFCSGAVAGYMLGRFPGVTIASAGGYGALTVCVSLSMLLVVALEGIICLFMAAPLVVPLGWLGGLFGGAVAKSSRGVEPGALAAPLFALPLGVWLEDQIAPPLDRVVFTSVEVSAPRPVVWDRVVRFPDLPPPTEWIFQAGVSCPTGATIDGEGVGAVRRCLFTTGEFVEPITAWEAPARLAFDVAAQPEPMFELTPYAHVHPPHLKNSFRSLRGEFRLIELPEGRTRLEGRTWYRLRLAPEWYWVGVSEPILHTIHLRVLNHVKTLAEADAGRR